ncbi:hypothetical protein AOLI_G00266530 [Acnodon oligacanthus]
MRATASVSADFPLAAQRGLNFALNWPPYDVTRHGRDIGDGTLFIVLSALTVASEPVRLLVISRVVKRKMGL